MWDGKSVDKVRYLRFYLRTEKQRLESGMLGPRQAKEAEREIARLKAEIKKVQEEKKAEKGGCDGCGKQRERKLQKKERQ